MQKSLKFVAVLVAALALGVAHAAGVDPAAAFQSLASPDASTAIGLAAASALGTIKYVQQGRVLDWVNGTGVAVASGKMIVAGTKVGVALQNIAIAATGPAQVCGVFSYAKLSTDVMAQGAAIYYDTANDRLTLTSAGNTLAGFAFNAAGNGVLTVNICVNGQPG